MKAIEAVKSQKLFYEERIAKLSNAVNQ